MLRQYFFVCFLLICFSISAEVMNAQGRGERVKSLKIAFLTEKLNLDPQTAEKFWPVYHQYDEEMHQILLNSRKQNDARSTDDILEQEQLAVDTKRKYSALFQKVISSEQLNQLFRAEREFNAMLIRRVQRNENREEMMNRRFDRMRSEPRMNPQRDNRMQRPSTPSDRPSSSPRYQSNDPQRSNTSPRQTPRNND